MLRERLVALYRDNDDEGWLDDENENVDPTSECALTVPSLVAAVRSMCEQHSSIVGAASDLWRLHHYVHSLMGRDTTAMLRFSHLLECVDMYCDEVGFFTELVVERINELSTTSSARSTWVCFTALADLLEQVVKACIAFTKELNVVHAYLRPRLHCAQADTRARQAGAALHRLTIAFPAITAAVCNLARPCSSDSSDGQVVPFEHVSGRVADVAGQLHSLRRCIKAVELVATARDVELLVGEFTSLNAVCEQGGVMARCSGVVGDC